jgi:Ala-tRNA(Pro) deacylase
MQMQHPDEPTLYAAFDRIGLDYRTEEHEAVFTVEDGREIKARLPGGHSKNLFLKDKAGEFFLISALGDTPVRLNRLHSHIGCKRLSFGKEDVLLELLGVRPGSVTVFSVINDQKRRVRLILDRALWDHKHVWFHPMRNTASTRMTPDDILAFVRDTGHDPLILDLKALSEAD